MIDIKLLRDRPDEVLATYRERLFDGEAAAAAEQLLGLDKQRRSLASRVEELKGKRNTESAAVGREKDPEKRQALLAAMNNYKEEIGRLDGELGALDAAVRTIELQLPNL